MKKQTAFILLFIESLVLDMFCLKGKEVRINFALLSSFLDKGGHTVFVIYGKTQKKSSVQTEGSYLDQRSVYYKESRLLFS